MAGTPWFLRLKKTPTPRVIKAAEESLAGMTAGKRTFDDADRFVGLQQHVPWPALHESLAASIARAKATLQKAQA